MAKATLARHDDVHLFGPFRLDLEIGYFFLGIFG